MIAKLLTTTVLACLVIYGCDSDKPSEPNGESPSWTEIEVTGTPPRSGHLVYARLAPIPNSRTILMFTIDGDVFSLDQDSTRWQKLSKLPERLIEDRVPSSVLVDTSNSIIFVNDHNRIYISHDDAASWEIVNDSFHIMALHPSDSCVCYGRKRQTSIYGGGDGFFYRSSDCGKTWTKVGAISDSGIAINAVLVHPQNPAIFLAAVNDSRHEGGIFKSYDSGITWTRTERNSCLSLVATPQSPDRVYYGEALTTQHFYRSDDFGDTWEICGSDGGFGGKLCVNPVDSENLVIAGYSLKISHDGGNTWSTTGVSHLAEAVFSSDGSVVFYCHNYAGIGKIGSDATFYPEPIWQGFPAERGIRPGSTCRQLIVADGATLFSRLYGGTVIRRSIDDSLWTRLITPFYDPRLLAASHSSDKVYLYGDRLSYRPQTPSLGVTTISADTWEFHDAPENLEVLEVSPWDPGHLVALQEFYEPGRRPKLLVSIDGGENWSSLLEDEFIRKIRIAPHLNSMMLLADSSFYVASGSFENLEKIQPPDPLLDIIPSPFHEPPYVILSTNGFYWYNTATQAWEIEQKWPHFTSMADYLVADFNNRTYLVIAGNQGDTACLALIRSDGYEMFFPPYLVDALGFDGTTLFALMVAEYGFVDKGIWQIHMSDLVK